MINRKLRSAYSEDHHPLLQEIEGHRIRADPGCRKVPEPTSVYTIGQRRPRVGQRVLTLLKLIGRRMLTLWERKSGLPTHHCKFAELDLTPGEVFLTAHVKIRCNRPGSDAACHGHEGR
jgi:hypothetical protein